MQEQNPNQQTSNASATMEAFFTRQKSEDGVKLDLFLPDGKPTEHWLIIRGVDSEAFLDAKREHEKKLFDLSKDADVERKAHAHMRQAILELTAVLVKGWSFPQECNKANVINFLKEAPQIKEKIDELAARRTLFFRKASTTS